MNNRFLFLELCQVNVFSLSEVFSQQTYNLVSIIAI
jgi:hypothetical protein